MNNEYIFYLTILIYQTFNLENKHILIDEFYNKIRVIYFDYKKHDNYEKSLLDSINDYIDNNKDFIYEKIKNCFE